MHLLETHSSLLQSTEAAHCPQCEGHARARALLVLNPAGSTSSARSGFGLLGGRCLDPAHASTERCEHGQEQRACVPRRGKVPPHPLRRPKQRFDGESALCSEDHVRLISHKPAATRLDLPGLASTLRWACDDCRPLGLARLCFIASRRVPAPSRRLILCASGKTGGWEPRGVPLALVLPNVAPHAVSGDAPNMCVELRCESRIASEPQRSPTRSR